MTKKLIFSALLFGLFGGVTLFLFVIYLLYNETREPLASIGVVLLVGLIAFLPMLFRRIKNKGNTNFSSLVSVGFPSVVFALVIYTIVTIIYFNTAISQNEKNALIDEKVERLIMGHEGGAIDIFDFEEEARLDFIYGVFDLISDLFSFLIFSPFIVLVCVLFALILKPKVEYQEQNNEQSESLT